MADQLGGGYADCPGESGRCLAAEAVCDDHVRDEVGCLDVDQHFYHAFVVLVATAGNFANSIGCVRPAGALWVRHEVVADRPELLPLPWAHGTGATA